MRIRLGGALLAITLVLAGCGSDEPAPLFEEDGSGGGADYSYTIPAGSGEAIDRGEPLDVLPDSLEVRVGELFELINEDNRGHLVGPFFVGAGETVRQRFNAPGSFIGICTVHPSGEFVLTVVE
ncbi:MAG: hypothetical protein QNJ89_12175 [Acidimicrobiia bacterium]|nr:hypothetical protein [Acidimicrobiia bacterium]